MKKALGIFCLVILCVCGGSPAARAERSAEELFDEGVAFLEKQDYEKAADAFRACMWALPEDDRHLDSVYDNLGLAYINTGKADEGIECFHKSISLNPAYVLPYAHLGAAYRDKGELLSAISSLIGALKLKPDFPQAHDELWRAYGQLGREKGYTPELLLREIYHIENLLKLEPGTIKDVPGIMKELRYLVALDKEIKKTDVQGAGDKVVFQGAPNAEDASSVTVAAVFGEALELPDDGISQEIKLEYLAQAQEQVKGLLGQ